jgi:hypothetical protein
VKDLLLFTASKSKMGRAVIRHKNFFDELWAKDHPEEVA